MGEGKRCRKEKKKKKEGEKKAEQQHLEEWETARVAEYQAAELYIQRLDEFAIQQTTTAKCEYSPRQWSIGVG